MDVLCFSAIGHFYGHLVEFDEWKDNNGKIIMQLVEAPKSEILNLRKDREGQYT